MLAADLLMPFHDFRAQLPARARPNFADLSALAMRYGVSLAAATLRWLEYTETRTILIVSNEGFAHWAKTSKPALKSGRFVRTKNTVFELPALATAVTRSFTAEAKVGFAQLSRPLRAALQEWLVPIALTTTSGAGLARLLLGKCRRRRIIVPGISSVERMVAQALLDAERHVAEHPTRGLDAGQCRLLDALLLPHAGTKPERSRMGAPATR